LTDEKFRFEAEGKRLATATASGFPRTGFLVGLALGHNGGAETVTEVVGEFVKLGVAVDLDGLLGGVANHVAVVAPSQMVFQFGFGTVVEDAVQIVG
jgi:hypothetical protein